VAAPSGKNREDPSDYASATAGPAVPLCLQIGRDEESPPVRRIDIIDLDRLDSLKEILPDDIGDAFLSKHLIIFAWFIQNQAQRGPRSATLVMDDPDGRDFPLILEGFLDHFSRLLRHVKHRFPPVKTKLTRNLRSAGRFTLV